MASVCVDANIALCVLLNDEHRESVERLWETWLGGDFDIITAPLFYAEVTSVLRQQAHRGRITDQEARDRLEDVIAWGVVPLEEDAAFLQRLAYDLAARFGQPRAYDSQYLAVASVAGCELWTLDKRLYNAVSRELPWVRYAGVAE